MNEFIVIALCLVLNAILSCIEMAFVTVSKAQIKKKAEAGLNSAKRVLQFKNNPERTLSVLQIGITLVGAISAAVGGAGAEIHLSPIYMETFSITEQTANLLAILTIVLPLTYFSVVIGELVPKSIALRFPLSIVLFGGVVLIILDRAFQPFVFLLEYSTRFFTKFVFSRFKSESIMNSSGEVDLENLSDMHKQYVFNLINVDKRTVKDVMLKWEDVSTVNDTDHYTEILEKIRSHRHTRLPVINADKGIIGLLHAKEFVSEAEVTKLDWTQLIRKVTYLNPGEPILNALKKLQGLKSHLAVIRKDGVPIGIVTIEDIFEEVVGEIYDEDDDPGTLLASNARIRQMTLKK